MAEGSLYDPDLAALAIKQARGDLIEAVFLIRAYRTTLPRLAAVAPGRYRRDGRATGASRPPSRTLPGGQVLGPTFDYTHRLLDFALMAEGEPSVRPPPDALAQRPEPRCRRRPGRASRMSPSFLNRDGLIEDRTARATPRRPT